MAGHKISEWYVRNKAHLMRRVNGVPGIVREVSFSPDPEVIPTVLSSTPQHSPASNVRTCLDACCLDRLPMRPQEEVLSFSTGTAFCVMDLRKPLGPGPVRPPSRKRRRMRRDSDHPDTAQMSGDNFTVRTLEEPCLLLRFAAPEAVLLLEHELADVHKQLPAPLYRHRYGT